MTWVENVLGVLMLLACGGYILGVLAVLAVIGGAKLEEDFCARWQCNERSNYDHRT